MCCTRDDCHGCLHDISIVEHHRVVKIHSCSLFLFQWISLLVIFGYYICYEQLYSNNGYQEKSSAEGVNFIQVNGVSLLNGTIWDSPEYVVSTKEDNSFTIPVNVLVSLQTINGTCSEAPSVSRPKCYSDAACPQGQMDNRSSNGILTGKCNLTTGLCEMYAWCPVQDTEDMSQRVYINSEHFTVYVRNDVVFREIDKNVSNIHPDLRNDSTFYTCLYDPEHEVNKHCPRFTAQQILSEAGYHINDTDIQKDGAVIKMIIKWDCDFDCVGQDQCLPTYSFERADRLFGGSNRYGFDVSYPDHKWNNGNLPVERVLYTMYGIRVVVLIQGEGRRFYWRTMGLTIGSGLSYLALVFVAMRILIQWYNCCTCECCGKKDEMSRCNCCWRNFELTDKKLPGHKRQGQKRPDQMSFLYHDEYNNCCCFTRKCCCAKCRSDKCFCSCCKMGPPTDENALLVNRQNPPRQQGEEEATSEQKLAAMLERLNQMEAQQKVLEAKLRVLQAGAPQASHGSIQPDASVHKQ